MKIITIILYSSALYTNTSGLLGKKFFEDQEIGTCILQALDTIEDTTSSLFYKI